MGRSWRWKCVDTVYPTTKHSLGTIFEAVGSHMTDVERRNTYDTMHMIKTVPRRKFGLSKSPLTGKEWEKAAREHWEAGSYKLYTMKSGPPKYWVIITNNNSLTIPYSYTYDTDNNTLDDEIPREHDHRTQQPKFTVPIIFLVSYSCIQLYLFLM